MALLMFTNMRPAEIRGLRWEDIGVENGLIHIQRNVVFVRNQPHVKGPKTDSGVRYHPLDPQLLNMYAEGVPPKLMQDTAGHANFNTTAKNYIHTQPKQIQEVGAIMQSRHARLGGLVGNEGA